MPPKTHDIEHQNDKGNQHGPLEVYLINVVLRSSLGIFHTFALMTGMNSRVKMYATDGSVVAGLVPATNPWYGIIPAHHHNYRKRGMGSTQIMQFSLMKVSVLSAKSA